MYNLLNKLMLSAKPRKKLYDQLVSALKDHYNPMPSEKYNTLISTAAVGSKGSMSLPNYVLQFSN